MKSATTSQAAFLASVLAVVISAGCTKLDYTEDVGGEYPPVSVDSVTVYQSEEELAATNRKYDIMGMAVTEGKWYSSRGGAASKIIKLAAQKGADAVVFVWVNDLAGVKSGLGDREHIPTYGSVKTVNSEGKTKRVKAFLVKFRK